MNSTIYSKVELTNKHGTEVPSYQKEVGTRISAVSELIGSKKYAAKVAGVSDDMLFRYIRGSSKQPFEAVAKLCNAAGVSMEWVWSGEGQMMIEANQVREDSAHYKALDFEDKLQYSYDAFLLCEEVLQAKNVDLPPAKKVELVKIVAGMLEKEDSESVRGNVYHLVALAS